MNDKEFLSYFDILASSKSTDPIIFSASNDLLNTLLAIEHNPSNPAKLQKDSPFGTKISEDLNYALNRVIRSCTSCDLKVQFQFSLVLKEILLKFDVIKSENYMEFVLKECNVKNSVKKSETPHFLVAKFLCLNALIGSKRLEIESFYSYFFEILLNDIQSFPFLEEFGIRILETSFYDAYKENKGKNLNEIKQRIKIISSKFKGILKTENPNHLRLIITIYKASKELLNTSDFPFKKQLENCVLDYNKLLKILIKSCEKFPKEPAFIQGIIEYMHDYCEIQGKSKEIWTKFWEYFVSELANNKENNSNFDFKKAFLVLCLMRRFLKQKNFQISHLRNILIPELIGLWLKNLNVQNAHLKKISKKIEKRLFYLIKSAEKTAENREIILEFVLLMKEKTFYKFSGSNSLAVVFFKEVLLEDFIEKYWKNLKKRLLASDDINMRLFLMSEILHFFEAKLNDLSEEKVLEIVAVIFKELNEEKIKKIMLKNEEETKEEGEIKQEVKKFQEKIYDHFYSLLNGVIKRNSVNFNEKKSMIWKGITKENLTFLVMILQACVNYEENSLEKQKRLEFLEKIQSISSEVQSSLKAVTKEKTLLKKLLSFFSLTCSVALMSFQFPEESFETLSELFQVYSEIFEEKGSKSSKKRKLNNGDEKKLIEKPLGIHVLMDVLVSLLAKSPNFLRDIIRRCFMEFMGEVDAMVLQNLTNVIIRKNEEYINDMMDDEE